MPPNDTPPEDGQPRSARITGKLTGEAARRKAEEEDKRQQQAPTRPKTPPAPPVIVWTLLEPDEHAHHMDLLTQWMREWLVPTHGHDLHQIRWCWAKHPAALDALTTLWQLWTIAWGEQAFPAERAQWTATWKRVLLEEAERALTSCKTGHKTPELPGGLASSLGIDVEDAA